LGTFVNLVIYELEYDYFLIYLHMKMECSSSCKILKHDYF